MRNRGISRRAMFALPVALPVAVAAAALPAARRYASGGVITSGTAWLGEAGPEAFLPLRRIEGLRIEIDSSQISALIARLNPKVAASHADDDMLANYVGG